MIWANKKIPPLQKEKEQHIVRKLKKQREHKHLLEEHKDIVKQYKKKRR